MASKKRASRYRNLLGETVLSKLYAGTYADLSGERVKLQVFAMRSMASGAAFHYAYLHATQQAFLEAHELAFA